MSGEPDDESEPQLEWSPPATTVPILDYGRPAARPKYFFATPVGIMFWISLGWFLLIMIFYAATLDGGNRERRCSADFAAYVFVAAIILIRRGKNLTKVDLAFIGFGYPAFVAITEQFF